VLSYHIRGWVAVTKDMLTEVLGCGARREIVRAAAALLECCVDVPQSGVLPGPD